VVVILVVGFWLARVISRAVGKVLVRSGKIEPMLANFLSSLVRYLVIAVAVIAALDQFGVETTSLVAVLGAAGLAISAWPCRARSAISPRAS